MADEVKDIRVNLHTIYSVEIDRLRKKIDKGSLNPSEIERLVTLTKGAKELQQFDRENHLNDQFSGISDEELVEIVSSKDARSKMGAVE